MARVLYPGSFDPITKGHMSIIDQASELFDEVVIAVLQNPSKNNSFFTIQERVELIKDLYKDNDNIIVIGEFGAAVDLAKQHGCKTIVRGLRGLTDFDYEIQMASVNKAISDNQINTVCLFADVLYQYISSSIVKEIFNLGKDISSYADSSVIEAMVKKVDY